MSSRAERRRVEVPTPRHGWDAPWPNAFELAAVLPTDKWTIVGGLMVQVHSIAHGIGEVRPTSDLDVILHIEIDPTVASETTRALDLLGYTTPAGPNDSDPHRCLLSRADRRRCIGR